MRELIDTLWNVNLLGKVMEQLTGMELTDTLWNVNFDEEYNEVTEEEGN